MTEREVIWVDTPDVFPTLLEELHRQPTVAVDTESDNMFVYRESVALLQFSTPTRDYLVDPKSDIPLQELEAFFADPGIEKIFHAAEYDLIGLWRDFHFKVNHIFDTMQASRILGKTRVGLAALLQEYFGVTLDKRWQRSDWGKRPLPAEQRAYAAYDTRYLIPLRDHLYQELVDRGLWELAQEDFERLSEPLEIDHTFNPQGFWHLPGVEDLAPQELRLLQALYLWREEEAKQHNVPPFRILHNQELVTLARRSPRSLAQVRSFLDRKRRNDRDFVARLFRAIQKAKSLSVPTPPPRSARPSPAYLRRLERLRSWRRERAQVLGVESDIVLPRSAMTAIAEHAPGSLEELRTLGVLGPVRLRLYGEEIVRLLKASND